VELTTEERAMLAGDHGQGVALAMRLVLALARSSGATRLLPITSAHVDGCLYHGAASLDFARRLRDLGASVAVPTTSNVGSVDLLHPGIVRSPGPELAAGRELMETYVELGCRMTFTCAPYQQLAGRPALGDHVAWAESNAIAFVNSVLGARTARYGDFIDISAAITGRVPDAGLHRDEHRLASLVLDCSQVSPELLAQDAGWGALGLVAGRLAGSGVPALTGIGSPVTEDHLKAFGAGAASSGTVGMFHVVGVTPEAPHLDAVLPSAAPPTVRVTTADLRAARDELSSPPDRPLDAVSLGTPHFSRAEFARLAHLLAGETAHRSVEVFVSTSRAVLEEATQDGSIATCEAAGARIVVDTCTYVTPILGTDVRHAMTNSAKWAWYAPTNLDVSVTLGTLEECVASAVAGRLVRDPSVWR
jgi:predicted aconitase